MTGLWALVKRNTKLYFRDKGMFFSSLITPVILLVLYATFLKRVFADSLRSGLAAGAAISGGVLEGCVGGQLVSSLLAVSCVTVAFCSNLLMIRDRASGARRDLTMAPVRPGVLALGYYLSTLLSTLIVNLTALAACLAYLGWTAWYLTAGDVGRMALDVLLLTLFGTALSSCVNCLLTTDGQASAVGTLVSAGYGFLCGAYMPISSFGDGLQRALSFLPGTYGTSLLRIHAMGGAFAALEAQGLPAEAVDAIRRSVDCRPVLCGAEVTVPAMYAILCGSTLALMGLFLLLSRLQRRK